MPIRRFGTLHIRLLVLIASAATAVSACTVKPNRKPASTPVVLSLLSTTAAGTYTVGASIEVGVLFSSAVVVTGTPTLALNSASPFSSATYASGSGSDTLHFTYLVKSGDSANPLNLLASPGLELKGGSIVSSGIGSAAADLVLPSATSVASLASAAIVVDGVTPSALNFASSPLVLNRLVAMTPVVSTHLGEPIVSCAGAVPSGLTLDVTGGECRISGTPDTTSAATAYPITATNAGGTSAAFNVNITVKAIIPSALSFADSPLVLTRLTTMTAVVSTHTGDPIVSCAGTVPSGLTLDVSGGECRISGTPDTTTAATDFPITATNTGGTSSAFNVNITVKAIIPSALNFAASSLVLTRLSAMTAAVSTHTGDPIVSCAGAVPSGLTLDVSEGECRISGAPDTIAVAADFPITATNTGGTSTAFNVNITVNAIIPSAVSMGPLVVVRNSAMTAAFSGHAGDPIISCVGAVPHGLTLDVSGGECRITGTPDVQAAATGYPLTATNTGGTSVAFTVTITVNAIVPSGLSFALSPLVLTRNTPTVAASTHIGDAIVSCSGALPHGLNLDVNGTECRISGTPDTLTGISTYPITATNTGGTSDAYNVIITVNAIAPSALTFAASPLVLTKDALMTPVYSRHTGDPVVSCTSIDTLPTGLFVEASGGQCRIYGTPTDAATGIAANYRITATNTGGPSAAFNMNIAIAGPDFTITTGGGQGYSVKAAPPASISGTCGPDVLSMDASSNLVTPGVIVNCGTTGAWTIADTTGGFIADQQENVIAIQAYSGAGQTGNSRTKSITITYCAALNALPGAVAPGGGPGADAGNAYELSTVANWVWLRANPGVGKFFKVMNDIDFKCYNWIPVGNSGADGRFNSTIDGQGYTLKNLIIDGTQGDTSPDEQGLFGMTNNAEIKNLNLTRVGIYGRDKVGGLVGYAFGDTIITNVSVSGTVEGIGTGVGLLAGFFHDTSLSSVGISDSDTSGLVKGTGIAGVAHGGFVGKMDSGISNSYSTATVSSSGNASVGGFIGEFYTDYTPPISNSYATGAVTGATNVGGFIAMVDSTVLGAAGVGASITTSYATGAVSGSGNYVGGFAGYAMPVTISKSYATGNVSGASQVGGYVGTGSGNVISDSFATGNVTASGQYSGGFAGKLTTTTANRVYSVGNLGGAGSDKGNLISFCSGTLTDVFALGNIATDHAVSVGNDSCSTVDATILKTAGQLKNASTYTNWDLMATPLWDIDEGNRYPTLH